MKNSAKHPGKRTPHAKASAVTIRGLYKKYGAHPVLKGIDLDAAPGEVVSLIGASGSGKSTLLRCINLLEIPDEGDIILDDEPVLMQRRRDGLMRPASRQQLESLRARVGMVFQNFNLWPHMTVLENIIEAPVHVLGQTRAAATETAHHLLEKVGLADKAGHYPARLSGGQQQRAAIARTLAMQPRVILLDEPTSALDPERVGEVLEVISRLAQEGITMILVTHEIGFAREVSHRTLFLHEGKIEEQGLSKHILTDPASPRLRQFLTRVL